MRTVFFTISNVPKDLHKREFAGEVAMRVYVPALYKRPGALAGAIRRAKAIVKRHLPKHSFARAVARYAETSGLQIELGDTGAWRYATP